MPAPPSAAVAAALDIRADAHAEDALYPCSDGRPMAENMWQAQAILSAASDLKVARSDALVASDILMYLEEGNSKNRIAPDVLVAFGLGTHNRLTYLLWKEGKPPDWVLEVASPGTVSNDLDRKRRIYAAMGVPEYWLFDPMGGLFPRGQARLQGLKLVDGEYRALEARSEDGLWNIRSEALGLELRVDGKLIRFRDPATGKEVRHHDESEAAAVREAALARAEAVRRKDAEACAKREAARAEREAARAEREAADRLAAQMRVAELEAELQRLRAGSSDERL